MQKIVALVCFFRFCKKYLIPFSYHSFMSKWGEFCKCTCAWRRGCWEMLNLNIEKYNFSIFPIHRLKINKILSVFVYMCGHININISLVWWSPKEWNASDNFFFFSHFVIVLSLKLFLIYKNIHIIFPYIKNNFREKLWQSGKGFHVMCYVL